MEFKPTAEQEKILEYVKNSEITKLKISAFAGAGKTATLKLIAQALHDKRGMYLAFNKAIADEAKQKMPNNIDSRTVHSLAFKNVSKKITDKTRKGLKLTATTFADSDICINSSKSVLGKIPAELLEKLREVEKLKGKDPNSIETEHIIDIDSTKQFRILSLAINNFLSSTDTNPAEKHLNKAIHKAIEADLDSNDTQMLAEWLLPSLQQLWNDYRSENGKFQIPHDVYLKLYALQKPRIDTDFILFDEAQDADALMLDVLSNQTAKLIFVGDRYQQIYDWRGAVNALDKFEAPEAYLTQSFRFGNEIAQNANKILKILNCPHDLKGVSPIQGEIAYYGDSTIPVDIQAIICRTNVSVVNETLAYHDKYPRKRLYMDMTGDKAELIELIDAMHDLAKDKDTYRRRNNISINCFSNYQELAEYAKLQPGDLSITPIYKMYEKHGYNKIRNAIDSFTSNKNNHDVIILTAHKSKGLEFDNVMYSEDFIGFYAKPNKHEDVVYPYFPFKDASSARVAYVAYTRAKKKLYKYNDDSESVEIAINQPLLKSKWGDHVAPPQTIETVPATAPTKKAQKTKRKYTKRSSEAEAKRQEAVKLGIQKTLEAGGNFGRPKAISDESNVIDLIKSNMTNQEIANQLGISISTVKRIKQRNRNVIAGTYKK